MVVQPIQQQFNQIKQKIDNAKDILIVLPYTNIPDSVSAGLALYISLKEHYSNKENQKIITISSATPLSQDLTALPESNQIQQSVGTKNLVLTLNTSQDNIEKVSTDDDQGKFNIIIETKQGINKLSKEDFSFSYRGNSSDLVISIGAFNQQQLGDLLIQEPKLLEGKEIITITNQYAAVGFGSINLNEPNASGMTEIVANFIRSVRMHIHEPAATNILAGIEYSTNNFSIKTNEDTFSLAGWCMKYGGKRNVLVSQPQNQGFSPRPFSPAINPSPFGMNNPFSPIPRPSFPVNQATPIQQPFTQPHNQYSTPQPFTEVQQFSNNQNNLNDNVEGADEDNKNPKNDWFKPKIFRGGQTV